MCQPLQQGQHETGNDGYRGNDVGDEMLAIGDKRRGSPKFAAIDQQPGPDGIDD